MYDVEHRTTGFDSTKTWLPQIGTASICGHVLTPNGILPQEVYTYKAVAQLLHTNNTGRGYNSPGPTELFDVQPGDIIDASITYYGVQHGTPDRENKLRFQAIIRRTRPGATSPDVDLPVDMWPDPGVAVDDANWQAGCIVESDPDGPPPEEHQPLTANFGGLAEFTPPIKFNEFAIDFIAPEQWLSSISTSYDLLEWDMIVDGKALASTAPPRRVRRI